MTAKSQSNGLFLVRKLLLYCSGLQGLYHAPVIPAGIRWNPAELFLAESPAKIAIPGTIYSSRIEPFQNWHWNGPGMDQNGILWNAVFFFFCMYDKLSIILTPLGGHAHLIWDVFVP